MWPDEREGAAVSWEAAWTGDGRAVHLGNIADFNAQFLAGRLDGARQRGWRRQGHHYACLAMFYSPHPALLVLPHSLDGAWLGLLSRQLDWDGVKLYTGIAGDAVRRGASGPARAPAPTAGDEPAVAALGPHPGVRAAGGASG